MCVTVRVGGAAWVFSPRGLRPCYRCISEHSQSFFQNAAPPAGKPAKRRKTASGAAASSSSPAGPGTILNGGRHYPAAWPSHIDLDDARSLMPPGCKLLKDTRENRWKACYPPPPPWGCVSRSWPQHGEGASLREVARICWQWRVKATRLPCPIADLIES